MIYTCYARIGVPRVKMIEDIINHTSPKTIGAALVAVVILWNITSWITNERKIRALGAHAPRVKAYLPWGTAPSLHVRSTR